MPQNTRTPRGFIGFIKARAKDLLFILVFIGAFEIWTSRGLKDSRLDDSRSFELLGTEGKEETLADGRAYTLVYAFAPWCDVCRISASNLNQLQDRFRTLALALNWSDRTSIEIFVKDSKLAVPVLIGDDAAAESLRVDSFPSYFVIDDEGNIRWAWSGYTTTFGIWLRMQLAKFMS